MSQKTVMNFAELKAAIEDGETTDILIGADVTFSGGIRVPASKKNAGHRRRRSHGDGQ